MIMETITLTVPIFDSLLFFLVIALVPMFVVVKIVGFVLQSILP